MHLVETPSLDLDAAVALIDAAARNAAQDVDYESSDRVAGFISEHHARMKTFVEVMDASEAADLASLLRRLGAKVNDLTLIGETQRTALVAAGLYPVTRRNLWAALGEVTRLALDVVKATNDDVYQHLLANLDDYLDVVAEDELTVVAADEFVGVLRDVAGATESAVFAVANGASEVCAVEDLEELDDTAWTAVVSAGRFAPTVWNVTQFVGKFGVTRDLAERLTSLNLTEAEEVEEDSRFDLGYELAGAEALDAGARVRLVRELKLPRGLDPGRLSETGLTILPTLLAAELVPDAAETYACISDRPFAFREEYFAASENLAAYVADLPLASEDLPQLMRSRRVAPDVKRAIADDVEFVSSRLSRLGAIAICEWASLGNSVSVDLLVELSEADAPAERILVLLEPHLPDIDLEVLDRILLALGDEYEPLTRVGHHRPKLKDREGTEELLEELERRDRVSSFSRSRFGAGIRVNMRH